MRASRSWRALPWLLALLVVAGQAHAAVHALSHIDVGTEHTLHSDHDSDHGLPGHAGVSHSDLTCKLCAAGHATLPAATLPLIPQHETHAWCAPPDNRSLAAPREQYLCRDPPRAG